MTRSTHQTVFTKYVLVYKDFLDHVTLVTLVIYPFLNENDPQFYQLCSSLDSKMNELTSIGLGVITKSASPITQEDELQL